MLYCDLCNYLFNLKKNVHDSNEIGFKFCENCGNVKKLDDNTLIYQSVSKTVKKYDLDILKYDIYQRKIINGCTNKKCPTNKDKKTEVVIFRNDNFDCYYICVTCDQKIDIK